MPQISKHPIINLTLAISTSRFRNLIILLTFMALPNTFPIVGIKGRGGTLNHFIVYRRWWRRRRLRRENSLLYYLPLRQWQRQRNTTSCCKSWRIIIVGYHFTFSFLIGRIIIRTLWWWCSAITVSIRRCICRKRSW